MTEIPGVAAEAPIIDPARAETGQHGAVAGLANDYPEGWHIPRHRHRRAQLVHAASGVMRITTPDGSWVTPPQRAVWVPAGMEHEIRMAGAVAMRSLYVAPEAAHGLPGRCAVVEVTPLLRELVLAAVAAAGEGMGATARSRLLSALILEELRSLAVVPLRIPLPRDPRLARLCRALLSDPGSDRTLEQWGEEAGATGRTLARLFRRELGMSFAAWRRQVRLAEALTRMAAGAPVAQVATDLGYDSPSAFTAMFRRALGTSPSSYFGGAAAGRGPEAGAQRA